MTRWFEVAYIKKHYRKLLNGFFDKSGIQHEWERREVVEAERYAE